MENVMTKGFTLLSEEEMEEINGGWRLHIDLGVVDFEVSSDDTKKLTNWYKKKVVPKCEKFGENVYDWKTKTFG